MAVIEHHMHYRNYVIVEKIVPRGRKCIRFWRTLGFTFDKRHLNRERRRYAKTLQGKIEHELFEKKRRIGKKTLRIIKAVERDIERKNNGNI